MKWIAWGKAGFLSVCLWPTSPHQNNIMSVCWLAPTVWNIATGWCASVKRCCCKNPPRSIDWLQFTLWFPLPRLPWPRWLATVALLLILSVPNKPWPEPEPRRLRITTASWAVTPAPARSRSWPSTGSGPRRAIPTRWGTQRSFRFDQKRFFWDFIFLLFLVYTRS